MNLASHLPTIEDDSFDLEHPAELSAETLSRGTRYTTDNERAALIAQLAALPITETLC